MRVWNWLANLKDLPKKFGPPKLLGSFGRRFARRKNSTVNRFPLARFSEITPGKYIPRLKEAIASAEDKLEQVLKLADHPEQMTFDNVINPLIDCEYMVAETVELFDLVKNAAVRDQEAFRELDEQATKLQKRFEARLNSDPKVYALVKVFSQSPAGRALVGDQARCLENILLNFKLSGAALSDNLRARFNKLQEEAALLQTKFEDNWSDSQFELVLTDEADLAGLPSEVQDAARELADKYRNDLEEKLDADQARELVPEGACIFNLNDDSYMSFMTFSESSTLRKKLYQANVARASAEANGGMLDTDGSESDLDNSEIIRKLLQNRKDKSELLGFNNFCEYSLASKMADTSEQVESKMLDLATGLKSLANQKIERFKKYQSQRGYQNSEGDDELYPWDFYYLAQKVREEDFDIKESELRKYFELNASLNGMLRFAEKFFKIQIIEEPGLDTWHPSVKAYRIRKKDGTELGYVYMDLYSRTGKYATADLPIISPGISARGSLDKAQDAIFCHFREPSATNPTLLNFDELTSLFHEFGHAMHHMFSNTKLKPLSSEEVAWDFVEVPSKLFENFAYNKEVLQSFAKHVETGKMIPDDLIENINKSKYHLKLVDYYLERAAKSIADMQLHRAEDPDAAIAAYKETINEYSPFAVVDGHGFLDSSLNCFHHIFGNPDHYAAGFYSYLWADSMAADIFQKIEDEGIEDSDIGERYRDRILAQGDRRDAVDLFRSLMKRDPSDEAFIKSLGL